MPFQLSAGVNITEIDLTTIVPAVSTAVGAIAGIFRWGPVGQRLLVDRETILSARFGTPSNLNAETWFTAANFLGYANQLMVVRAANTTGATPSADFNALGANSTVSNNIFTITSGSTAALETGMYVTQSSNSTIIGSGNNLSVTVINSTAISLSGNTNSNGTVTMYFGRPATAYSAVALANNGFVANLVGHIVRTEDEYATKDGTFDTDVMYVAKFPGSMGNSLRVAVCDTANAYQSNVNLLANATWTASLFAISVGSNTGTISVSNGTATNTSGNTYAAAVAANLVAGDLVSVGNSQIGTQYLKVTSIGAAVSNATVTTLTLSFEDPYRLSTDYTSNTITRHWEFFNVVDKAPGQSEYVQDYGNTAASDELHVVVVDENGDFTSAPGTILEVYTGLSRATNAKGPDNTDNYYKNVLNDKSQYIYWVNDRSNAASANAQFVASSTNYAPLSVNFTLGADGASEANTTLAVIAAGYDKFINSEDVDVSIVMQGKPLGGTTSSGGQTVTNYLLGNYIIDNIVTQRKDCVAVISPEKSTVVNNVGNEALTLVNWRNVLHDSSYAIMDSGYKYQYDRYNDMYRWIPLNGDIAGLCARTDQTNDAWWSPAGFNRGQIKNLVRLAFNPGKAERDTLYKNGINPVVTFPGQGTVLYGDKTLQSKPSAFDRINVRRLFIVLEKAIAVSSKFQLFEFNDEFTRRQFVNVVTPYLREIQGRRGITAFKVVCDDSNNTSQVIDSNQFVGDIYIKPARSINFIQLNFIAVPSGVQFSEVVGNF
jgi:hypothetical protein